MATVHTTCWWGPDGIEVWADWNPVTSEIEAVGAVNPTNLVWQVEYVWKDRTDTYQLAAWMPPTTISIPPGQRKRLATGTGELCKSPDIDGFNVRIL